MLISSLLQDPLIFVAYLVAIFYVLTVHEFSHALAALLAGDQTAKEMGRLTLNPFKHVDVLGLIVLFFAGFGWGKPVPINPNNFRRPRSGLFWVSLAGPLSNLISGIIFIILLRIVLTYTSLSAANLLVGFLLILIIINFTIFIFNLLPIPPLDGSKLLFSLLPEKFNKFKYWLSYYGPWLLIGLIILDNFTNLGIFSTIFTKFLSIISYLID